MNVVSSISIYSKLQPLYITNPFPQKTDPYNSPYESVNWSEIYQYYPPNGIQYINPYQRRFSPTDTSLLKQPSILRISSTRLSSLSIQMN
jgi:hypothetical protein